MNGPLIDGKVRTSSAKREIKSPWDRTVVGEVALANTNDVSDAIAVGAKAAEKMRDLRSYQRADILHKAADLIHEKSEEIAVLIASEGGKPIKEARSEALRGESTFRLAAEATRQITGELLPLDITPAAGERIALVRKFPIGLVTGISPFNFPLNLVAHKVAPAIASGCAINLKPASTTPLTALLLGNILLEAGLPESAFNVLPCNSADAGALIEDARVKMITFTGSGEVGWDIKARARKKRVCLELGGNAVVIVAKSADIEHAVRRTAVGGYAHTGQICISVQHVLVAAEIYDQFFERYISKVRSLKVGNPLDETTEVASLIDEKESARVESWVREAVSAGGHLLTGGNRDGSKLEPVVLQNVPDACKISYDEAFGPVTLLQRFQKLPLALEWVNRQQFGLQAGIFTNDLDEAMMAFNRLEVGGVIVGDVPTFRSDNYPYGGVKNSGFGREGVRYAMDEMSELKTLVLPFVR